MPVDRAADAGSREAAPVTIDPVAAGGFSAAASTYARIRPTYARPAIGAIKDLCPRGGRVLDVAAGTGILTGQLVRAGLDVTAVEPLAEMARHLRLALPAVPLVRGVVEHLGVRDDSFDVVTVAQAFHWFDFQAALSELARVLAPDGVLVLVWNARDASVPWVDELTRLVEQRTGGRPYDDHREVSWSEVVAASGRFGPLDERRYPNPIPTTLDGVIDRLRSTSFVAVLDDAERAVLLDAARDLLAGHPELVGTFAYPHHTIVHAARLAHR